MLGFGACAMCGSVHIIEHMFEPPPFPDPEPTGVPGWMWSADPMEGLEWVLTQPPSAETWQGLEVLGRIIGHDPVARVLLAVAWDRQISAATARMYAAVADA